MEVVKVTLVDITGKAMYRYVRPVNEVVEFNTKFRCVDKDFFKIWQKIFGKRAAGLKKTYL